MFRPKSRLRSFFKSETLQYSIALFVNVASFAYLVNNLSSKKDLFALTSPLAGGVMLFGFDRLYQSGRSFVNAVSRSFFMSVVLVVEIDVIVGFSLTKWAFFPAMIIAPIVMNATMNNENLRIRDIGKRGMEHVRGISRPLSAHLRNPYTYFTMLSVTSGVIYNMFMVFRVPFQSRAFVASSFVLVSGLAYGINCLSYAGRSILTSVVHGVSVLFITLGVVDGGRMGFMYLLDTNRKEVEAEIGKFALPAIDLIGALFCSSVFATAFADEHKAKSEEDDVLDLSRAGDSEAKRMLRREAQGEAGVSTSLSASACEPRTTAQDRFESMTP